MSHFPRGEYTVGQQVAALMGGMGRTYNGGYAEYTRVPVRQVVPFTSSLDWATLGAVPEMLQTSHGLLTIGLDSRSDSTPDPASRSSYVAAHRQSGWPPQCSPNDSA